MSEMNHQMSNMSNTGGRCHYGDAHIISPLICLRCVVEGLMCSGGLVISGAAQCF